MYVSWASIQIRPGGFAAEETRWRRVIVETSHVTTCCSTELSHYSEQFCSCHENYAVSKLLEKSK